MAKTTNPKDDIDQDAMTAVHAATSPPATASHGRTRNEIIDSVTDYFIDDLKKNPRNITPEQIATELTLLLEEQFNLENAMRPRGISQYRPPLVLPPDVIAELMAYRFHIKRIALSGLGVDAEYDLIGMYVDEGTDEGIYTTSEIELTKAARRFNRRLTKKEFDEIIFTLKTLVERDERCNERDLIVVNNGIYNYVTKELLPFTPDKVFVTKSHVDYNHAAQNIVIHNDADGTDWDIESWMKELNDDPNVVNLLWQLLGAAIRPNVSWNKSAWFYAQSGNNGKGTLCELMRALCGERTHVSLKLSDLGKEFMLEPLVHASAIITDENAVGKYIDDVANLKAIITNDIVPMNRKHKEPISFRFRGFMVQCVNEMPRVRDKSDSFYRRQLFIPFEKSYTGCERKYIKDDYIKRPEVLEYVLLRVLEMMPDYYELAEPACCKAALDEYKEYNDPVRQFLVEMLPRFKWDLLPNDFLYDLYREWFKRNNPSGSIQGKSSFLSELRQFISTANKDWIDNTKKPTRSNNRMVDPEPLIFEYELKNWYNKLYTGSNPDRISTTIPKAVYRGLLRASAHSPSDDESDTEDE